MATALHIVCPHCDSINRVPRERLRDGAKCGSCHRPLYERRPAALDSLARFDKHAKHSDIPLLDAGGGSRPPHQRRSLDHLMGIAELLEQLRSDQQLGV